MDELRVDPREAAKRVADGGAYLLDVVSSGSWATLRQIPAGALRIPPEEITDRIDELPTDKDALAFCT